MTSWRAFTAGVSSRDGVLMAGPQRLFVEAPRGSLVKRLLVFVHLYFFYFIETFQDSVSLVRGQSRKGIFIIIGHGIEEKG